MTLTVIVEHGKYFTTVHYFKILPCLHSLKIQNDTEKQVHKMVPFDIVANLHKLVNKEPYRIMNVHVEKPDD